jgi:hypothetical protein
MKRTSEDQRILAEIFSRMPLVQMLYLTQDDIEQMLFYAKGTRQKLRESHDGNKKAEA